MTAKLLEAFQCEVLINDPFLSDKSIQTVSIEKGIRESDFIILHCSGNDQILTKELLFNCKEGVTILNPSRFQNIDESALKIGLKTGKIDRLWLDVFDNEPYNGELLELCNVIATPHIASHTKATREKMERESFLNLLNQI